jgi:iron complex outermembrane receptor protein
MISGRKAAVGPAGVPALVLFGLIAVPSSGLAQNRVPDLSQVSIEDLMNIEITSASRKEQRAADAAAAVYVITHDDIRRSGMTTVPDLLRLAPGVEVAHINSNKWAVSVRGFNGLFANKLLVLVDGRSVYNRLFSGVTWDTEDLILDDIDRIEVIRGPGAALWGANAVNGVINIITKASADTQGVLVRADGGRSNEQGAVRYGGTVGATRYRLYSQWTGREESLIAPGTRANDGSHSVTTGFRADWTASPGEFMIEGDFTSGQARALWPNLDPSAGRDPIANDPSDTQGGHLLGRWTRPRPGGASLQVQAFVDIAGRQEPVLDYRRHAFGIDTQYHSPFGARQDLVAGAGYRFIEENFGGRVG